MKQEQKPLYPRCAITCGKYTGERAKRIKCNKCRDRRICMDKV